MKIRPALAALASALLAAAVSTTAMLSVNFSALKGRACRSDLSLGVMFQAASDA